MAELQTLVERLEAGELSLEEALAAFEDGVGLVRYLSEKLTEADQRVEILIRNLDGSFQLEEWEEEGT